MFDGSLSISIEALSISIEALLARYIFRLEPFLGQVCDLSKTAYSSCACKLTRLQGLPEQFLVYHAGTLRTVFIGVSKITTIALFFCSCVVLAPALYMSSENPAWAVLGGEKE